ncbi:MAG TPA: hypothetical protein VKU41_11825 [Polyangiaceae bacterium]|nr:hypothetical protein [Polyangiaceae bacterium]
MSPLGIGIALFAAFLLGARVGIALGHRSANRRKGDPPGARA